MNIHEYINEDIDNYSDVILFTENKHTILYIDKNGFLLTNTKGVYLLDYKNIETLSKITNLIGRDCALICSHNNKYENLLKEKFNFDNKKICYQYIYKENKMFNVDNNIEYKTIDLKYFEYLKNNYPLSINDEYLKTLLSLKKIIGRFINDKLVGFIGTHDSGTMGLLFVDKQYRNKKIGINLEKYLINILLEKNIIPVCHVETENSISVNLQEKLNMTKCSKLLYWYS